MKKRVGIIFCLLLFFVGCGTNSAVDLRAWVGCYGWSDSSPGATSGSTPLWEYHAISIYEEKGHFYADYILSGYQLGVGAKAKVEGDKGKITLVLMEYDPDTVQQPFDIGDELCSLTKIGNDLVTTWIADGPSFKGNDIGSEGAYFVRDDSIKEYIDRFKAM